MQLPMYEERHRIGFGEEVHEELKPPDEGKFWFRFFSAIENEVANSLKRFTRRDVAQTFRIAEKLLTILITSDCIYFNNYQDKLLDMIYKLLVVKVKVSIL